MNRITVDFNFSTDVGGGSNRDNVYQKSASGSFCVKSFTLAPLPPLPGGGPEPLKQLPLAVVIKIGNNNSEL